MPTKQHSEDTADSLLVSVRFPVKFSLLIALATVLLSGLYYWDTRSLKDTLIFLSATAAATATILIALYTARTLNLQTAIARDQLRMSKRVKSMDYAARWNAPEMLETRRICRQVVDVKDTGLANIKVAIEQYNATDSVIHLLNFFEELSVAIDEEVVDPNVLDDFFAEICFQVWAALEPWVREHRRVRDAKNLWGGLEKLNNLWKQR